MSDKQRTAQLIPWYINGTLPEKERVEVEAYLAAGGADAESELAFYRLMQQQSAAGRGDSTPGEFGWRRLQQDLHESTATKSAPEKRIIGFRPAMAAAIAVIVIQGVLISSIWQPDQASDLQPLSGEVATHAVLQVQFQPEATALEIRNLLQEVRASVVDGPSAAGIYRLKLATDSIQDREAVLERLQRSLSVIEHVAEE